MKRFFKALCALMVCASFVTLPACNTTKGAGKDIEKAGESIKNSADKHGAD